MLTLEEQIERVADAAVAEADQPVRSKPDSVSSLRQGGARRGVGLAAGLLVLSMLGALTWLVLTRIESPDVADQSTEVPSLPALLPPNEPTIEADPEQEWLVPARLPEGVEFDYAGYGAGFGSMLSYVNATGDESFLILAESQTFKSVGGDEVLDIDGVEWSLDEDANDDGSVFRTLSRPQDIDSEYGAVGIVIRGELSRDEIVDVAASLTPVAATDLPRPPLPMGLEPGEGIIVATAEADGVPKQLMAETDGVHFVLSVGGGGGGPGRLPIGDYISVAGAMSSNPNLVVNGAEADSMFWGLLHPAVVTVDVELTDGRVITTQPQDGYGFAENFFFVAVPTRTEGGMELLDGFVARDANGAVLQRIDKFGR